MFNSAQYPDILDMNVTATYFFCFFFFHVPRIYGFNFPTFHDFIHKIFMQRVLEKGKWLCARGKASASFRWIFP